ncbi:hypothetical protein BC941DRAFT_443313, partial [Chlamydoabsidia padenii]
MINEDNALTSSGFFDTTSSSNYLMNGDSFNSNSNSNTGLTNRPYSSQLYNSNFALDEEDPWGSVAAFDPVTDFRRQLTTINSASEPIRTITAAVDEDTLTEGVTAASVLVGVYLPEIFDTAYIRANPMGDRIGLGSLVKVLHLAGLSSRLQEKIITLVAPPNASYVTRNEFNTALALVAFAQKNMELSLVNVYRHKHDLPIPIFPDLDSLNIPKSKSSLLVTRESTKINHTAVIDDPWRTTTTTTTTLSINSNPINQSNGSSAQHATLNSNSNRSSEGIKETAQRIPSSEPKTTTTTTTTTRMNTDNWITDIDSIKVTVAPEKEGFLFKHINYIVESPTQTSLVARRYSDFYWLWEVLLKRYPCRLVPNIPPKKISGRNDLFLESRRQGLSRFIHGIARHPVLKNDTVFISFMTEPSEFLAWRRANPPSLDEEFVRVNTDLVPDDISACIPRDLDDRLEKMEKTLDHRLECYMSLYSGMEALAHLGQSQKSELEHYSSTLNDVGSVEKHCFMPNCQACSHMVTQGYDSVAKYMCQAGSILDQEASDIVSGVMNQLKQHYDTLLAFKVCM